MIKSNTADAVVIPAGGGAASLNFMTVDNLLAWGVAALTIMLLLIRIDIAWRARRNQRKHGTEDI